MADCLKDKITRTLLPTVRGPAQYIGGEVGQIRKQYKSGDLTAVLAFPDAYSVGMSHLGLSILYTVLNAMSNVLAERTYCPLPDAAEIMRKRGIPLFSWESRRPVRDFDILGITLQNELSYSNVLYLLDLAGIEFSATTRGEGQPLVIGGGPMADCCEPVADFFDMLILGDGEEALPAVLNAYAQLRKRNIKRRELLLELARRFEFVYVPQLYQCHYNSDGTLAGCASVEPDLPKCVRRAVVTDLDSTAFPTATIVAHTETVHDRIAIEIMRGCPHRCAFCHAGYTRGPLRYRSVERIAELAQAGYLATGHDTVSLLSLSTSDYPHLAELVSRLYSQFEGKNLGISLPSLRVDSRLRDIPASVADVRREGLTVAVEAASDRIRSAIGKSVTDADLLETMLNAYKLGWRKVKLYFMVGFLGETEADIAGIVELAAKVSQLRQQVAGHVASVNVAVSYLVPKPHTPFGWIAQRDGEYFSKAKSELIDLKRQLKGASIQLKFHRVEQSLLEAALARGDRRLSGVIETAYRNGAFFDNWHEHFDHRIYEQAFGERGLEQAFYAHRSRGQNEILPWDHLDGDNKDKLYRRLERIDELLKKSSRATGSTNR